MAEAWAEVDPSMAGQRVFTAEDVDRLVAAAQGAGRRSDGRRPVNVMANLKALIERGGIPDPMPAPKPTLTSRAGLIAAATAVCDQHLESS